MQHRDLAIPGVCICFSVFNFSAGLAALRVIDGALGLRSPSVEGTAVLTGLAVLGYIGYKSFAGLAAPVAGPNPQGEKQVS